MPLFRILFELMEILLPGAGNTAQIIPTNLGHFLDGPRLCVIIAGLSIENKQDDVELSQRTIIK